MAFANVEPGDGGWLIWVAHDVVWWHGAATAGACDARAASHDTEQASSASGWLSAASAKAATTRRRASRDMA